MANRIVAGGHPDPDPAPFNRALAKAYVDGARERGRDVRLGSRDLDFPFLRSSAA